MWTKKVFVLVGAGFFWLSAAQAQTLPAPNLLSVYPSGGQVGSTFELTVTGTDLDHAEGLYFDFPGARVEVQGSIETVKVQETKKKKGGGGKRTGGQVSQRFKVTLPKSVVPGIHDVRIATKGGVSNPRAFMVGTMKEIVEQEPNNYVDQAQKVELNTAISGVIATPTDVDYFEFTGRKGQHVVLSCLTTSIDSRLRAQVELYSTSGKFLGSNRDYHNNDALLDAVLPEDGNYLVRLFCFTYTLGGPDYFYRLSISTAPWIDAVVPAVVEAGKETQVTVYGRNLPKGVSDPTAQLDGKTLEKLSVTIKAPSDSKAIQRLNYGGLILPFSSGLDGFPLTVSNDSGPSNPYLIGYAHGSVTIDNGNNATLETAQPVQTPGAIAGRLLKKGDRHYYAFIAKKGQVLNLELFSERLGSPADLYLELFSLKNGKHSPISKQEDTPDGFGNQFPTTTADPPAYRFVAPADGTYFVLVNSLEGYTQFGPRHVYTLSIAGDEPDFRLIAMPASTHLAEAVVLGQGGNQAYSLFVWRLRGFSGDIALSAESLPPGVSMKAQVISASQKQAGFVVSAAPDAPAGVGALKLVGTAVIGGQKVSREVRGASITWSTPQQQNIPAMGRLDRDLVLAVRDKAPFRLTVDKDKITVLQGEKITVPVKVGFDSYKGNIYLTTLALPNGLTLQPTILAPGKETVTITLDTKGGGGNLLPGNYNLVLRGLTRDPKANQGGKKSGDKADYTQAAPAVSVTIVPKQVAKLAQINDVKIKAGGEADLVVRLARQAGYEGTFKVELVIPPGKGITAQSGAMQQGEDEVKLHVHADKGAIIGQSVNLIVRVTAMFNDTTPVIHETKASLVVSK